jgi:hypothetical protein
MARQSLLILTLLGLAVSVSPVYPDSPAAQGKAFDLAYKFTPGETARIRIYQHTTGTRTLTGSSAPTSIDVELTTVIRLKCAQVQPDGTAEISIETESSVLSIGGKRADAPQDPEPRTLRVAPSGKVVEPGEPKTAQPGARRSMLDFSSVESIVLLVLLPDRPVRIGDSWSAEIPLRSAPDSKLLLDFRLEDVRRVTGVETAVINLGLSTPINPDAPADSTTTHGTQEGSAELFFAVDKGALLTASGSVRSVLTTYLPSPRLPGADPNSQPRYNVSVFKLQSKLAARRLDDAPKDASAH